VVSTIGTEVIVGASIAVVGAGIAGLSAAFDLQKAGHEVVVYECDDMAGGRMADRIVNGICVHTGASVIFPFNKAMFELIDEMGIRGDVVGEGASDGAVTVNNGTIEYPLRLTFNPGFLLAHPAFGMRTKLRLATLLPDLLRSRLQVDPCMMHTAVRFDDETVTSYVERMVSREFLEDYVEPYFRAPWHWEPERISRAYLIALMGHVLGASELSFRFGIGQLTRTLASRLTVRTGVAVQSVAVEAQRCRLALVGRDGARTEHADFVVLAVPGTRVSEMLPGLDPVDRAFFDGIRYTRGARIYYALSDRNFAPCARWFTRRSTSRFSLFHAIPQDLLVPEGHVQPGYLQCEFTPQMSEQIAHEGGQSRLDGYARPEIARLYPEVADRIVGAAEQWWDDMLPEWYPGYARSVASFLSRREDLPSRVYYCGDYVSQSHAGGACASGRATAALLQHHWRSSAAHS